MNERSTVYQGGFMENQDSTESNVVQGADAESFDREPTEEEIKAEEDIYFLKSIAPKDENEKRRVLGALHRTYLTDRGKR